MIAIMPTYRIGQQIECFDPAQNCWVPRVVLNYNPDGTFNVNSQAAVPVESLKSNHTFLQFPQVLGIQHILTITGCWFQDWVLVAMTLEVTVLGWSWILQFVLPTPAPVVVFKQPLPVLSPAIKVINISISWGSFEFGSDNNLNVGIRRHLFQSSQLSQPPSSRN